MRSTLASAISDVTDAAGIPTGTPQNAPVLVGLGFIALGGIALWYRRDLYLATQYLFRYRTGGPLYVVIQIGLPIAMVGWARTCNLTFLRLGMPMVLDLGCSEKQLIAEGYRKQPTVLVPV